VLRVEFQLDSLVYKYVVDQMQTQFQLALDVVRRNYCVRWEGSVFWKFPARNC
jgi:hypothetical protein